MVYKSLLIRSFRGYLFNAWSKIKEEKSIIDNDLEEIYEISINDVIP